MSLREEVRGILEAVEEHGAIPFKGEKKYIPHMTVDQATYAILKAVGDGLPKEKTREMMLDCLTKTTDSVESMLKKHTAISEITGYNQALSDIKSRLEGGK